MNNQKPNTEAIEFQQIMINFWSDDVFKNKTLAQIHKDFSLSGIELHFDALGQCSSQNELEELINQSLNERNIARLVYVVDLNSHLILENENLAKAIVTRLAFKVFLRSYFDSQNRS